MGELREKQKQKKKKKKRAREVPVDDASLLSVDLATGEPIGEGAKKEKKAKGNQPAGAGKKKRAEAQKKGGDKKRRSSLRTT